jgi:hypothetical protein
MVTPGSIGRELLAAATMLPCGPEPSFGGVLIRSSSSVVGSG